MDYQPLDKFPRYKAQFLTNKISYRLISLIKSNNQSLLESTGLPLETNWQTIAKDVVAGNRRALARAITIVENDRTEADFLLKELFTHCGKSHIIGVTGSPGVGKSTLVDALIREIRKIDLKVGVLAIDPSSPFSGGAILGDRIRMQEHTLDKGVFIRSMANRGHTGGTALATFDAIRVLEASGYEIIIIETVGVGQSELAIAQTADTTILVLMPGSGDEIQAIKSGIMEIGDIFVVNKGDLPGSHKTATEILNSLELVTYNNAWKPPVVVAIAETGLAMDQVWAKVQEHQKYLQSSGELQAKRIRKIQSELEELVAEMARQNVQFSLEHAPHLKDLLLKVVSRKLDPHSAACELAQELFGAANGSWHFALAGKTSKAKQNQKQL